MSNKQGQLSRNDEVLTGGEFRIKLGDQWYYRGNRSPSWFYTASRADGSCQGGISEKCPPALWPLLNAVAERLAGAVSETRRTDAERATSHALYAALSILQNPHTEGAKSDALEMVQRAIALRDSRPASAPCSETRRMEELLERAASVLNCSSFDTDRTLAAEIRALKKATPQDDAMAMNEFRKRLNEPVGSAPCVVGTTESATSQEMRHAGKPASHAPASSADLVLVPRNPTVEMLTAGAKAADLHSHSPRGIWAAMLAAAGNHGPSRQQKEKQ